MAWAHEICNEDNEERAIVVATMNEMAYVIQAWLPLIIWQQVDAPQYRTGYITISVFAVLLIITSFTLRVLWKKELVRKQRDIDSSAEQSVTDTLSADVKSAGVAVKDE